MVGLFLFNFSLLVATCRGLSLSITGGTFVDKLPFIPSFILSLRNLRHIQNRGEANCISGDIGRARMFPPKKDPKPLNRPIDTIVNLIPSI